ncbi:GatB/YqeY domain-containing protein [Phragmitibacter flavus]|uniref:GatB/YqeY domain-containing protein n=1 Tax=Phragmitibacter flavus TaxID=2576071 RepID=A0A5R8KK21_9BACT|nr:GatB/YqeY domain-containing protein [Phragmitibacter flavus]TLD72668.1 GatB/YqeY domain-containing protein [Phragmitibacter flavus]
MSTIAARLTEDMKTAMKAKDSVTLNVVRGLKSSLKYAAIEKAGADGELDDNEALVVIRREIKKRQDSVSQYESGGRPELAATEKAEIAVLENYLPAAMSEADLIALVDAVIAETGATTKKDMGKVMKLLQERSEGRADNKVLSTEVNKRLG